MNRQQKLEKGMLVWPNQRRNRTGLNERVGQILSKHISMWTAEEHAWLQKVRPAQYAKYVARETTRKFTENRIADLVHGELRWNLTYSKYEAWDGNTWVEINPF